jgi:hypothetical protein
VEVGPNERSFAKLYGGISQTLAATGPDRFDEPDEDDDEE